MSKLILMSRMLTADMGEVDLGCYECAGTGMVQQRVPISWTTIKEIYAKAVELLGVEQQEKAG